MTKHAANKTKDLSGSNGFVLMFFFFYSAKSLLSPADFQTQTSSVGKIPPLPTVIDTSDFPGEFNFEILFEEGKSRPTKHTPWTFSPSLGKLFAKINSMVPIAVRLKGNWT